MVTPQPAICVICGKKVTTGDYIVPIENGGSNIAFFCENCYYKKLLEKVSILNKRPNQNLGR